MKRSQAPEMAAPAGAFMPDGSFNPEAGWSQQGPAHALVTSLERRAKELTPTQAASLIRSAKGEHAFPYVDQWESCGQWWACWTSTSAEQWVKSSAVAP